MGIRASKQLFGLDEGTPEPREGVNAPQSVVNEPPVATVVPSPPTTTTTTSEAEKQAKVMTKINALGEKTASQLFGNPSQASRTFASSSELQNNLATSVTDGDNASNPREIPVKLVIIGEPNLLLRVGASLQGYQYNAMHVALQIGARLVDWCDHSLVYPRALKATTAFAAVELGVLNLDLHFSRFDKLCKMMEDWNVNEQYDQKTKNCQHFVDEALKILELKVPQDGVIGEFLKQVRKGRLDKSVPSLSTFDPDAPAAFSTHLELDTYFIKLLSKKYVGCTTQDAWPQFKKEHPDVYSLLKGFDRAFWMLKFTTPKDPKGDCFKEAHRNCCPFPFSEKTTTDAQRQLYG